MITRPPELAVVAAIWLVLFVVGYVTYPLLGIA